MSLSWCRSRAADLDRCVKAVDGLVSRSAAFREAAVGAHAACRVRHGEWLFGVKLLNADETVHMERLSAFDDWVLSFRFSSQLDRLWARPALCT